MIKRLLLIFTIIGCSLYAYSQENSADINYYKESKIFYEDGYAYKCKSGAGFIDLYNVDNKWVNIQKVYMDTGEIPELFTSMLKAPYHKLRIRRIVQKTFTDEQLKNIGDEYFMIELYINSSSGRVDGVLFNFFKDEYFTKIPISYYRKIELELKKKLKYKLTKAGKRMNYVRSVKYCYPNDIKKEHY